jgi:hypothetical protein
MHKEIGIKSYFGGLGDALQFSTLPEIFSNMGYHVYLTEDSDFRNEEIKELVWIDNPFIKGIKKIEWSLGDIPGRIYENKVDNFIKNWEIIHGINPTNDFPKIYYQPKYVDGMDIIIDISAQSTQYDDKILIDNIKKFIDLKYPNSQCKLVTSKMYPVSDNFGFDLIEIKNLKHYVDIINSCNVFISGSSGSHSLAASIRHINKRFDQICFIPETSNSETTNYSYFTKSKHFIYPLVNYIKI